MTSIAHLCHTLKKDFHPKQRDLTQPVSCWREKDLIQGKPVDVFVIILRTRGCAWAHISGCTMCGYFTDSAGKPVPPSALKHQLEAAFTTYKNEPFVKIFTSGSFFDETELPREIQQEILQMFASNVKKLSVESRPEFITKENLSRILKIIDAEQFEIGVGLETTNDWIRTYCINKGFTFEHYKKAAQTMKKHGIPLKTYVLLKPPFLSEQESITDCLMTIDKISSLTTTISLNPTNVQQRTLVEYLWRRNQYRPPWLWSIMEVLRQGKKRTHQRIQCTVVGGGSKRGAHNCGICDHQILQAINTFSLKQDPTVLTNITCSCQQHWRDQCDLEELSFRSLFDMPKEKI